MSGLRMGTASGVGWVHPALVQVFRASNLKLQTPNSSVIEGLGGAEVGEEVADLLVGEVGEEAFGHEAGR